MAPPDGAVLDTHAILDRVPAAIYRLSPDALVVYINKSGATIAGYSQEEIVGGAFLTHVADAGDSAPDATSNTWLARHEGGAAEPEMPLALAAREVSEIPVTPGVVCFSTG